jgi:hypothetical protein
VFSVLFDDLSSAFYGAGTTHQSRGSKVTTVFYEVGVAQSSLHVFGFDT